MSSMAPGRALEGGGSTRWGPDCIVVREVPTTPARCLGLQFQHSPDPFQRRSRGEIPSQGGRKPLPPSATAPGDAHGRPTQVGIHITLSDPPAYRLHNTKIKHTVLGPGFLGETTARHTGLMSGASWEGSPRALPLTLFLIVWPPARRSLGNQAFVCVWGAPNSRGASTTDTQGGRSRSLPPGRAGGRHRAGWVGWCRRGWSR